MDTTMKRVALGLGLLVLSATGIPGTAAAAFSGLEKMPGYDRYQKMRQMQGDLVAGGAVSQVRWADDGQSFEYRVGEQRFRFDLVTKMVSALEAPAEEGDEERGGRRPGAGRRPARGAQRDFEPSPDGQWNARCVDWNVVLERTDELGGVVSVTTDGTRKKRYGKASWVYGEELRQIDAMFWSPDSTKLAYYELDESAVRDFFLVGNLNTNRTELMLEGYPKPGEPNPIAQLWMYDLKSGESIRVEDGDDPESYIYNVRFSPKGDWLLFNRTNRHQNVMEMMAADPATGASHVVVKETQETWQDNSPEIRFLEDGQRFIWATEKSGWQQFELRDLSGALIGALTQGRFPAASISRVDEAGEYLYYTAYSDEQPLFLHLHRVRLDGAGQQRLTPAGANHTVEYSRDGKWFLSRMETIESPPRTALFTIDGAQVAVLTEADLSAAQAEGVAPPEMFICKAADGTTDLYGVLYKPSNFDPDASYPLVLDVYGGPTSKRVNARYRASYPETEFGLCIAVIDNRGTPGRGKAFEGAAYLKLGDVDIADQVAGIRHLLKRPYLDARRVGVFGHSYGGYMSALAITKFPDVFHVAVAGGTVVDWRQYDTIYTERYMRTPQENEAGYDAGSILTYAEQLRGKLLLLHGMVDDNVHPTNAWQLVDALQDADKPFDMMFYPTNGHGLGRHATKLRWEYLVRHLVLEPTFDAPYEQAVPAAPIAPAGPAAPGN